jgi:uncharacterized repeat protein (TIGR04138 family)
MQALNFEAALDKMIQSDQRYKRNAYLFIREALDFTQKVVEKKTKDEVRHVSGQELLAGIRRYALERFGPMTQMVFNEWGIRTCEDFGELVFTMVENNLLAKTTQDSREDFKNGYDFFEAFRRPFLPVKEVPTLEGEPKSTQV